MPSSASACRGDRTFARRACRVLAPAFALTVLVGGLSCGTGEGDKSPTAPPAPVMVLTTMTVALSATTVPVGQTGTANATGADQNGGSIATGAVTWSSSSPVIATISAVGAITAVAVGQTTITATAGSKSAQATLTVITVPVVSVIALSAAAVTLDAIGATQALVATPQDAGGATMSDVTVQWTTSASSVASVTSMGVVTAVGNGSAVITAAAFGKAATATVTVLQVVSRLSVVDGDPIVVAGQPIVSPLRVRLVDRLGATATLATATVTISALSGAVAGVSSAVIALGEARFDDLRFPSAGTTRVRLTASAGIPPIDTSVLVLERPLGLLRVTLDWSDYHNNYYEGGGVYRMAPLVEAVDGDGRLLNVSGLVRAAVVGGTADIISGDTVRLVAGSARYAMLRYHAPTDRPVTMAFYSTVLSQGTVADFWGQFESPDMVLQLAVAADSVVTRDSLFALDISVDTRGQTVGAIRADITFDSSRVALVSDSVMTSSGSMTRSPVGLSVSTYSFSYLHTTGLTATTRLLRLRFQAKTSGSARVDLLPKQMATPLGVSFEIYTSPKSVLVRIP